MRNRGRVRADPRRLRVHDRVPDREDVGRQPRAAHLRRCERDYEGTRRPRVVTRYLSTPLICLEHANTKCVSVLAEPSIDSEIDRVFLQEPETNSSATGRQQVVTTYLGESIPYGADAGKRNQAEPPQDALRGNGQTVLRLSSKHPAILVTPARIPSQIVHRPKETQIVNGNAVPRSRTAHRAEGKHLMFAQRVVLIEAGPVILIAPIAPKTRGEKITQHLHEQTVCRIENAIPGVPLKARTQGHGRLAQQLVPDLIDDLC